MGSQPDISIITSLYRSERYLRRYSRAVVEVAEELKTAGTLLELVIVANDATSREKRAIDGLTSRLHSAGLAQVVVLHVDRELLYASWNRGVRASSAECLGFWNADDLRNAAALSEGLRSIRLGVEVVYFPFVEVTRRYSLGFLRSVDVFFPKVPEFERSEFTRSMMVGPFFLFSRGLYERVGPFDEQFRIVGDFDWCIRAAKATEFHLGRSVAGVFWHDGTGISAKGNPRHVVENNVVYLRHGVPDKLLPVDPSLITQYRIPFEGEQATKPSEIDRQPLRCPMGAKVLGDDCWDEAWERQQRTLRRRGRLVRLLKRPFRILARGLRAASDSR